MKIPCEICKHSEICKFMEDVMDGLIPATLQNHITVNVSCKYYEHDKRRIERNTSWEKCEVITNGNEELYPKDYTRKDVPTTTSNGTT